MVWQQEHKLSYESFLEKYRIVTICFLGAFLLLSLRLLHLQVIRGKYYKSVSEEQRTQIILERAARGLIYDQNNRIIVGNRTAFVALFYPFTQEAELPKELLTRLSKIFDIKDLSSQIATGWRKGQVVRLAENLSREDMFRIQEQRLVIPGISVVKESRRNYNFPEANSHLIGYLNEISRKELNNLKNEGYKMGDWVGQRGLEEVYDSLLRGRDGGWQIEVDAFGRQTRLVKHIPSFIGNSLYTTINLDLQKVAYEELKKSPTGRGAVIGLDPRSGAVRIFVSCPGFNPELSFSKEFKNYLTDNELPLFNRTIQALYPPGSLFKVITFVAAVAEEKIDLEKEIVCKGKFYFGKKTYNCWEKKGHGKISLIPALAKSCNVYFYHLGLKTHVDTISKYARRFRLDKPTGIEIPSEKVGLVPDKKWKKEKLDEVWLPGDTINMAIGQGPLWFSPVQVAVMMASIANKGTFYKPYILEKVISPQGDVVRQVGKDKLGEIKLEDNVWDLLHLGLREVVRDGTGQWCKFKTLEVAGKTGTAENPHGEDHAWFSAYAPADNPELVLVVIVENGGSGGSVAAPIARKIFKEAFREQTKRDW
ncbi:MAG: penicillin-binding protein 2 [Endomicrobiales bacterium]|nr:penicillin-binding protein 2 [Endomicrobiales bacterium]